MKKQASACLVFVLIAGCSESERVKRLKSESEALQQMTRGLQEELMGARAELLHRGEELEDARKALRECRAREELICGFKLTLTMAGRAPDPALARSSLKEGRYWDVVSLRMADGKEHRFANRDGRLVSEEFREGVFFIDLEYFPVSPIDFVGREVSYLTTVEALEVDIADLFSQANLFPVREIGLDTLAVEINSRQVALGRFLKPVSGNLDQGPATFDLTPQFSVVENAYHRADTAPLSQRLTADEGNLEP